MLPKTAFLVGLLAFSLLLNILIIVKNDRRRVTSCARENIHGANVASAKGIRAEISEGILITGAAGFIGMHLALRLVMSKALGGVGLSPDKVIGIDHFDDFYSAELKEKRAAELQRAGIRVWEGSLCDGEIMGQIFRENSFTHVVHLAGHPRTWHRRGWPEKFDSTHVDCFRGLVETIVEFAPRAHLIYASSSDVYSASIKTPLTEDATADVPSSFHGVKKRTNELLASAYYSSSGLHSTGLRFFTVYGEWDRPDTLIHNLSHAIATGNPISLFGLGNSSHDFVYIGDVVDGIILASQYRAPTEERVGLPSFGVPLPEIFNLGSGRPVKVTELIRMLEGRLSGAAMVVGESGPSWGALESTQADISKAASVLGWRPRTTLEEGLGKFVSWYQSKQQQQLHGSESPPVVGSSSRQAREGGGAAALQHPHPKSWQEAYPQLAQKGATNWTDIYPQNRSDHEVLRRRTALPVIAIVTGTTSRKITVRSVREHPVCVLLLKSLFDTVEAGFEYWVYIGYDEGDPMFDDPATRATLSQLFEQRASILLEGRDLVVQLALVRVTNPVRKPGPVFNFVSAAAYDDGADYFFRVNDDTEFQTVWARRLVKVLSSFSPPNLGVVGVQEGNARILIFDFTHRTHREIFGVHYPPALTDWWLDDWISAVYPRENIMRVLDVKARHATASHGRKKGGWRYEVDKSKQKALGSLVDEGKLVLGRYLRSRMLGQCQLLQGNNRWQGAQFEGIREVLEAVDRVNSTLGEPLRTKKAKGIPEARSGLPYIGAPGSDSVWASNLTGTQSVASKRMSSGIRGSDPNLQPRQEAADKRRASISVEMALESVRAEVDHTAAIEIARRAALESTYPHPWVIVMLVNSGVLSLALNWICNLVNRGLQEMLPSTVFVTLDDEANATLAALGHTTVQLSVPGVGWDQMLPYGSPGFFALMHLRQELILDLLERNISVLVAEPDATWYGDLIDYVESTDQFRGADAISYNDAVSADPQGGFPCGGLLFLRATPSALELMRAIHARHRQALIERKTLPEQLVLKQFWKTVKGSFVLLPADKFVSGKWYERAAAAAPASAAADGLMFVHANYMMGTSKKVAVMRTRRQWHLDLDNECIKQ